MNKVLIDCRHIYNDNGFSTYIKTILKAIDSGEQEFYLLVNYKEYNFCKYIKHNQNIKYIYAKSRPFSLEQNFEIPILIKKNNINVFHSINFDIPLFMFLAPKCKQLTTIHDVIPLCNSKLYRRNIFKKIYIYIMFRICVNLSRKILTVSEYSKKEIMSYLQVKPEKISVIYNVFIEKNQNHQSKKIKMQKPVNLFFVGNNFYHKNISTLLKAVEILKGKNIEVKLNIAGKETAYTDTLRSYIKKHNLDDNVFIKGSVPDNILENLYSTSDIFVFPSLVEGFGYPLIEAMNYGLPIISSNKTVMPEIVGDAGLLIEPTPENFAKSIEYLIKNPEYCKKLIFNGFQRAKIFSQEKFSEQILKIYGDI